MSRQDYHLCLRDKTFVNDPKASVTDMANRLVNPLYLPHSSMRPPRRRCPRWCAVGPNQWSEPFACDCWTERVACFLKAFLNTERSCPKKCVWNPLVIQWAASCCHSFPNVRVLGFDQLRFEAAKFFYSSYKENSLNCCYLLLFPFFFWSSHEKLFKGVKDAHLFPGPSFCLRWIWWGFYLWWRRQCTYRWCCSVYWSGWPLYGIA